MNQNQINQELSMAQKLLWSGSHDEAKQIVTKLINDLQEKKLLGANPLSYEDN